jgi:hypothetical protein
MKQIYIEEKCIDIDYKGEKEQKGVKKRRWKKRG